MYNCEDYLMHHWTDLLVEKMQPITMVFFHQIREISSRCFLKLILEIAFD